jgi:hypothetical protein
MKRFQYVVTVETDTEEHADQVMGERLGFDEEYTDEAGVEFDYSLPYQQRESCAACNSWYEGKPIINRSGSK